MTALEMQSSDCVLCNEDGGRLLWRNDSLRVVAVDDELPGYTRVIRRSHQPEMTDLSTLEQHELMQAVFLIEGVQRQILQAHKVNLASLGNMTPHLHWHIVPRWRDDPWFPDSIWAPRRPATESAVTAWQTRRASLADLLPAYEAALHAALRPL